MNRFSIFAKILVKSVFKPKLARELIEERNQINDEHNWRNHQYQYDFDSIDDFFSKKFPDINIKKYEKELVQLENSVEKFFKELEMEEYPSIEKPYPINYSINSDLRRFLYILCRIMKPENIIETGVAYGLSSMYILSALDKNESGILHSIDSIFRPWQTEKMIGSIIPESLKKRWKFTLGKSVDKLQETFDNAKNVDIFIHDSLHTYKNMIFEFECANKNLREKALIISDDVLDNDAFFNFTIKRKLENYLIKVDNDLGLGFIQKN